MFQSLSLSELCPDVGLCRYPHLEQEEASLMMVERGTNVLVDLNIPKGNLSLYSLIRTGVFGFLQDP